MALELNSADLAFLLDIVNTSGQIRDVSGFGNNIANPTWGTAGQPFDRLTSAQYADGVSAPRVGPNVRDISNIIAEQSDTPGGPQVDQPNAFGGNSFLTTFGQFFDHGLDFVQKGGNGSIAVAPGFIPLTRATIAPGTGTDASNPAQHLNQTSPFVDQNQTYGSHQEVTNLLRARDAGGNLTAYLLDGFTDSSGKGMLPTVADVKANALLAGIVLTDANFLNGYNGSGPLLLDVNPGVPLDQHFVGGDGRLNENIALTPIHTIWHREHNYQVDRLKQLTGNTWTEEQYFQAAKVIVEAEYQRVVFDEFADALVGGIPGPSHGFGGYDPTVNPTIVAEFAHAAYRLGHSMVNETVTYIDQTTGQSQTVSLVQAFLNPNLFATIGVDAIIAGDTSVHHQAIDENVVNAVRNQLVGLQADLASFNLARGRDTGLGTLNQVRAELFALTGDPSLQPYTGWADFAAHMKDPSVVELFKQAYGSADADVNNVDLWIGGLVEQEVNGGQLGSTFAWIFINQLDRLQDGDRFYYKERLDGTNLLDGIEGQTFSDIIARNSGLADLPGNIFNVYNKIVLNDVSNTRTGTIEDDHILAKGGNDVVRGAAGDDSIHGGNGLDQLFGDAGDDFLYGDAGNDTLNGGLGDDSLHGGIGLDVLNGGDGDDALFGDAGADTLNGGDGDDEMSGGAGNDTIRGNLGDDRAMGGSGNDTMFGDAGADRLDGGEGNDTMNGGADDDRLEGGAGNDTISTGGGNNRVDGGTGNDRITLEGLLDEVNFGLNGGRDTIVRFNITQDVIALGEWGLTDIGDLSIARIGANTVITLDANNSITLMGVRSGLTEANFDFALV